jgi:hypothetical protein
MRPSVGHSRFELEPHRGQAVHVVRDGIGGALPRGARILFRAAARRALRAWSACSRGANDKARPPEITQPYAGVLSTSGHATDAGPSVPGGSDSRGAMAPALDAAGRTRVKELERSLRRFAPDRFSLKRAPGKGADLFGSPECSRFVDRCRGVCAVSAAGV